MGPSWGGLGRARRAGHPERVSPPQLSDEPRLCIRPECKLSRRGRLRGLSGWGGENSPAGTAVGVAFLSGKGRVVVQRIFPAPGRAYAMGAGLSDRTGREATTELLVPALVPLSLGETDGLSVHFPKGA